MIYTPRQQESATFGRYSATSRGGWQKPAGPAGEAFADLTWIGRKLGSSYDHVAAEPLPDRCAELLCLIEMRERGTGGRR